MVRTAKSAPYLGNVGYGMGQRTEIAPGSLVAETVTAERARRENDVQTGRLLQGLPRHRDLIRKIVERGLPTI